jgi:hypothetical protein
VRRITHRTPPARAGAARRDGGSRLKPPLTKLSLAALAAAGLGFVPIQFYFYADFRGAGSDPSLVLPPRLVLGSVLAGILSGSILFVPAAAAALGILVWQQWGVPIGRHRSGRCFRCGYALAGPRCAECGETASGFDRDGALPRVLLLVVLVWIASVSVGSIAREAWVSADDYSFRRDIREDPSIMRWRTRRWPNQDSTVHFSPERGFWGVD